MPETEVFLNEESLAEDAEHFENMPAAEYEEREICELDGSETEEKTVLQESFEPGRHAVLDQKGGEPDDWILEYKGDSGYRFDGRDVRGPEGTIWTNEDAALHQDMLAQWAEGGSAVFFLPDYKEQLDDREILYVTQLILGEKGDVTYEIHKHETIYSKGEDLGEKIGGYADALMEPQFGAVEYDHKESGVERSTVTFIGAEATIDLSVHDPESSEFADGFRLQEVITPIAIERAESVADAPMEDVSENIGDVAKSGKTDGPDSWLVELLNFDVLDPVESDNAFIAEVNAPQEAIANPAERISHADVSVEPVKIHATIAGIAESQEPIQDAIVMEEPTTVQTEMVEEISPVSAEMQESPSDTVDRIKSVHIEPVADTVESELSRPLLKAVETKEFERNDLKISSVAERSKAPELLEVPNMTVGLEEIANVQIQEPVAEEYELMQSVQTADKSGEIKSSTNDNSQPSPFQNAETILRALGIPISIPQHPQEIEHAGLKSISGITPTASSPQQTRTGTNRSRGSARSHRDGVVLEIAARAAR